MFLQPLRHALPAALALTLTLAAEPVAAIEPGRASAFVQDLGDQAIRAVAREDLDKQSRAAEFRRLLRRGFAIEGIGRFVLGRYWRGSSEAQQERYLKVFEDLIVATYAARFEQYDGQTFSVSGERADGEEGRIVESRIEQQGGETYNLQWRVRQAADGLKIVDVLVEGVSMAITQRSEFSAVMRRHGGSLDGLIQELEAKVARLR